MRHEHTIFRSIAEHEAYNIQIKSRAAEHEEQRQRGGRGHTRRRRRHETGEQLWTGGRPMEAETRGGRAGADFEDSRRTSRLQTTAPRQVRSPSGDAGPAPRQGRLPVDEQRSSQADTCRLLSPSPITLTRSRGKGLAR
jgi:hypothetical protein